MSNKSFTIFQESETFSGSLIHYGLGVPVYVGAVVVIGTWKRLRSMRNWVSKHSDEIPVEEIVKDIAEVVIPEII